MKTIAITKNFVELWDCSMNQAAEEEGWDRESGIPAEDYLRDSCGFQIIPVDMEEAEKIATSYSGEHKFEVREKAWEILRENGVWYDAKRREIAALVKAGDLKASFSGNTAKVSFMGETSEFEGNEFGEWEETFGKVLSLLDIEGEDEVVNYMFSVFAGEGK